MFVLLQAVGQVEPPLVQVGGVEAGLAAVVAGLAVDVGAAVPVPTLPHLEEGAEEGLGLAGGHLHARVGEASVDHLGPALGLHRAGHELCGLCPVLGCSPGLRDGQRHQAGGVRVSRDLDTTRGGPGVVIRLKVGGSEGVSNVGRELTSREFE